VAKTYDIQINCAQDFVLDLDVERKNTSTGELEAYSGITSVTLLLSATRGSSTPIHANLSKAASERAGTAGRITATFDVADLQAQLLPTYRGKTVFLNVFKSGELQYEPFTCLVTGDRLGV
jgi:hypothetical protein